MVSRRESSLRPVSVFDRYRPVSNTGATDRYQYHHLWGDTRYQSQMTQNSHFGPDTSADRYHGNIRALTPAAPTTPACAIASGPWT